MRVRVRIAATVASAKAAAAIVPVAAPTTAAHVPPATAITATPRLTRPVAGWRSLTAVLRSLTVTVGTAVGCHRRWSRVVEP